MDPILNLDQPQPQQQQQQHHHHHHHFENEYHRHYQQEQQQQQHHYHHHQQLSLPPIRELIQSEASLPSRLQITSRPFIPASNSSSSSPSHSSSSLNYQPFLNTALRYDSRPTHQPSHFDASTTTTPTDDIPNDRIRQGLPYYYSRLQDKPQQLRRASADIQRESFEFRRNSVPIASRSSMTPMSNRSDQYPPEQPSLPPPSQSVSNYYLNHPQTPPKYHVQQQKYSPELSYPPLRHRSGSDSTVSTRSSSPTPTTPVGYGSPVSPGLSRKRGRSSKRSSDSHHQSLSKIPEYQQQLPKSSAFVPYSNLSTFTSNDLSVQTYPQRSFTAPQLNRQREYSTVPVSPDQPDSSKRYKRQMTETDFHHRIETKFTMMQEEGREPQLVESPQNSPHAEFSNSQLALLSSTTDPEMAEKEQATILILQSMMNNRRAGTDDSYPPPPSNPNQECEKKDAATTPLTKETDDQQERKPSTSTSGDESPKEEKKVPDSNSSHSPTSSLQTIIKSENHHLDSLPVEEKNSGDHGGGDGGGGGGDDGGADDGDNEGGDDDDDDDLAMDDGSEDETIELKCEDFPRKQDQKIFSVDTTADWNSDDMLTEEEEEVEIPIELPVISRETSQKEVDLKDTQVSKSITSSPPPTSSSLFNSSCHEQIPSPKPKQNTSVRAPSRKNSNASSSDVSTKEVKESTISAVTSDVSDSVPSGSGVSTLKRSCPPRRRSTLKDSAEEKLELDKIEWEKNIEIPDYIWEETLRLFESVKQSKEMKNRQPHRKRNHILASILYILCRQHGLPRTFVEICNAAGIRKQEIGTYYRLMLKVFDSNGLCSGNNGPSLKMVDSAEFLKRWCQNLKLPEHILDASINVYKKASVLNITTGKCPVSVGAAAIWLSITSWNDTRMAEWSTNNDAELIKCEHKDVAAAAGVVNATLAGCFKNLSKYKDELLPPEFLTEAKTRVPPPTHQTSSSAAASTHNVNQFSNKNEGSTNSATAEKCQVDNY